MAPRSVGEQSDPLVFTGLVTPHDPDSGEVVVGSDEVDPAARAARYGSPMLDMPLDRALAQAWTSYRNLVSCLEKHDVGFDRLVRLRILLRDLRDLPIVQSVSEMFLGDVRPALSVVEIPTHGVDPSISVALDAVAAGPSAPQPQPLASRDGDGTHGVEAGNLIFIGATFGRDPETQSIPSAVGDVSGLPPELEEMALLGPREQEIGVQSWLIFRAISDLLATQGGSLGDVVKLGGWLTFPMREYKPLADVRHYYASAEGLRPASGAIQIQALPNGGALAFEAVAVASGSSRSHGQTSAMSEIYTDVEYGGDYVWTSGEVPIEPSAHAVVDRIRELHGDDRTFAAGTLHSSPRAEIQARDVYRKLCSYVSDVGSSTADVAHQTIFIRTPVDYLGVERAARAYLGPVLPPTTIIPVCDVSPSEQTDVEIELVARASGGQQ